MVSNRIQNRGTRKLRPALSWLLAVVLAFGLVAVVLPPSQAVAQATTVEVGSSTVAVGSSSSVDVWVRNYPLVPEEYAFGLGAYDITVAFDPAELTINSVIGGNPPFNSPCIIMQTDNVQIAAFPGTGAPDGDIKICTLNFTCEAESVSTLALTVTCLSDTDGSEMANTPVNGTITQARMGTIALNPTYGPRGTTVSVTGTDFATNETGITITWDGSAVITGVTARVDGSWGPETFAVLTAATLGTHTVDAYGAIITAAFVPDKTFTVSAPAIAINPTTGIRGTSVQVTGTNFAVSETGIAVTWDDTAVIIGVTAGADGSWGPETFIVPTTATLGTHTVDTYGAITPATDIPDKTFTVSTPSIAINPTAGIRGTSVQVTGTNFAVSETGITITWDGTPLITGVTASIDGSWGPQTFEVPSIATLGIHTVDVYGDITPATDVPNITFTVTVLVEIEDATVVVGRHSSVDIWVRNYPVVPDVTPYGLGSYTIRIDFNPTTINVTGVSPGDAPFDAPVFKIYDTYVEITQFSTEWPGPDGDIRLCDLEFRCMVKGITNLNLSVERLINVNGGHIANTPVDGTITHIVSYDADTTIAENHDLDGVVVIPVTIVRVMDSDTHDTTPSIKIANYVANL